MNTPQLINVDAIDFNEGQVEGLLPNPRELSEENFEKLKKQIIEYPEMLEYRGIIAYPHQSGRYIAIGGNQRLRALKELQIKQTPCFVIPTDTTPEQLNAYQILDNVPFGRWDTTKLLEDWDVTQLANFAINVPVPESSLDLEEFFDEGDDTTKTKVIVILPPDLQGLKDEVKEYIKSELNDNNYLGCKVK